MPLFRALALFIVTLCLASPAWAEVHLQAAVDQQEAFVGEAFTLQVQVEGDDAPPAPELSALTDFGVEARGGQQNSSESVTIVNGHMNRVSHRGYVFTYGLTPKRAGRLTIPPLVITIDGHPYQTQAIPILAKKPTETNDFKLRLELDKSRAYVGEPVTLTVTWYIGKDVNGFNFNLPVFNDPRLMVSDAAKTPTNANGGNIVRIPLTSGEILAEKAKGTLDGQNYLTVSFAKTLTAKEAGQLTIPQATVSCQTVSNRSLAGRDPLSGLFPDDFFGRSRQTMRTEVVPSNEPALEIVPLPEEGRPSNFSGLVGSYSLALSASPTKVKVGDPITLTIQVAGPAAATANLPSLEEALGPKDFKVPGEMSPGQGTTELKTFTQTVRALHPGVRQIPPLRLSTFNPINGRYEEVSSTAVPLEVSEAKMVTAQDAEGAEPVSVNKGELKAAKGGISYNYEGPELLLSQAAPEVLAIDGLWLTLLTLPPGAFLLVLLGCLLVRQRGKDPEGRAAKLAYQRLQAACLDRQAGTGYAPLGQALRDYLGASLRCNSAALTYVDVEPLLQKAGVAPETLDRLRQVMERCEACQYAGTTADPQDLTQLQAMAQQVATALARHF